MKNFAKKISGKLGILKYTLVQLVSKALVLISTYIIALLTTNEVFGYVSLLQAALVTAVTLFGFNLQSGFIRYYYSYNLHYIYYAARPLIVFLFLLSISVGGALLYIFEDHKYYIWFSLLPLIGFLNGIALVFSMLARGNDKFFLYLLAEIMRPISLFFVAVCFYFNEFNIVSIYIFALLFSLLFTVLVCLLKKENFIYIGEISKNNKLSTSTFVIYTTPLFFVQLMSLVNNVSDRYIMTYYLSISEIGQYGKAYLVGSSFGLFLDSLMLLWTPFVMKNRDGFIRSNLEKLHTVSVLICIFSLTLAIVPFTIGVPNLSRIGVSDQFMIIMVVILAAFLGRGGYQILTPVVSAHDKTSWVAKIALISMLIGLILSLILIPKIGVIGGAIATFAAYFSYSVFAIYLIRRLKLVT